MKLERASQIASILGFILSLALIIISNYTKFLSINVPLVTLFSFFIIVICVIPWIVLYTAKELPKKIVQINQLQNEITGLNKQVNDLIKKTEYLSLENEQLKTQNNEYKMINERNLKYKKAVISILITRESSKYEIIRDIKMEEFNEIVCAEIIGSLVEDGIVEGGSLQNNYRITNQYRERIKQKQII